MAADHRSRIVTRSNQGEIDREGDDENAKRQDGVSDDVVQRAVLDHQYCTFRST